MPILEPFVKERLKAVVDTTRNKTRINSSWVTKLRTYVGIPGFSISSTWRGASEIIAKFNYTLDAGSLSFRGITPQEGFVACISWKPTANTIVRYKLWENVGEILYVDLYDGESIGSNFAIEIWNTKPESGAGETLISEEGFGFEVEQSSDIIEADGSLIGTIVEVTSGGVNIYSSRMVLPQGKCLEVDILIGGIPTQCTDITFELEEWIPLDGDYYILDGNCGETLLIPGNRLVELVMTLQSTDGSWHDVYTYLMDGDVYLAVDQDDAAPAPDPAIYMRHNPTLLYYRIDLEAIETDGEVYHHLRFSQVAEDVEPKYTVAYLQAESTTDYYAVRVAETDGMFTLKPNQTPSDI